jgi:hypothetical protein
MITCIYAHVSDGVKWHRPRGRMGVRTAALAGWAAVVYGLCVQRVQWCRDCGLSSVVVVYQNTVVKPPRPLHPITP